MANKIFALNGKQNLCFKGGLISRIGVKLEHYPSKEKMLRRDIWHHFWDIRGESEKLSEIKAPLDEMKWIKF